MEIHFLTSFGGQKSEIHVWQGWFPPSPLSLASRQLSQLHVLTWTIDIFRWKNYPYGLLQAFLEFFYYMSI